MSQKQKLTKGNKILINILIIVSGVIIGNWYSKDIVSDYYFVFHKKSTQANIESVEDIGNKSYYFVSLSYHNEFNDKNESCDVSVDGHFLNKIKKDDIKNVNIFYTSKSTCDIYITDFNNPTLIIIIFRFLICILILYVLFIYIIKTIRVLFNRE